MTETIAYILLGIASLVGLGMCLVGLPGVWLIFAGAVGLDAILGWGHIHWGVLIALGVLAVIGSVVDDFIAGLGATRYGGSKWAGISAIAGSLLGAILFTPFIPAPVIGTVIGAFIGAYLGAFAVEYHLQKNSSRAARAAWGAFLGKLGGILLKFTCALIMIALIIWQLL